MNKLQDKLNSLINEQKSNQEKRATYHKQYLDTKSSISKNLRNRYDKEILKTSKKIDELEYQISVGGRKLLSATVVSKELSNAGFIKGEYTASRTVRGWGTWKGEFTVKSNITEIEINWIGSDSRYQEFLEFITSKYPNAKATDVKYIHIDR